ADLALCSMLAFWTGGDAEQIDRLFGESKLTRPKWEKRLDYRQRTIAKALKGRTEYYTPAQDNAVDNNGRPTILVTTEECEVNDRGVAAVARDASLYQRGGILVRIIGDDLAATGGIRWSAGPRIEPLPRELLRERLAAVAKWLVKSQQGRWVPGRPPGWCTGA